MGGELFSTPLMTPYGEGAHGRRTMDVEERARGRCTAYAQTTGAWSLGDPFFVTVHERTRLVSCCLDCCAFDSQSVSPAVRNAWADVSRAVCPAICNKDRSPLSPPRLPAPCGAPVNHRRIGSASLVTINIPAHPHVAAISNGAGSDPACGQALAAGARALELNLARPPTA